MSKVFSNPLPIWYYKDVIFYVTNLTFLYALVEKSVDIVDKVKVTVSMDDPVPESPAGAFSAVRTTLDNPGQLGQHM